MIHAYAIEPALMASWSKPSDYRFIREQFGLGSPRVLLEVPRFSSWRKAVRDHAAASGLEGLDATRLEALITLFQEHRCQRPDSVYDGQKAWLTNAEAEYGRRPFAAILALGNPRAHKAVHHGEAVGAGPHWERPRGELVERTPAGFANALRAMLSNSKVLHLVDPYFSPNSARHRDVLLALTEAVAQHRDGAFDVFVHCNDAQSLDFFDVEAAKLTSRLPPGASLSFRRWRQKPGGDRFHNRYVLTDLGGVSFGDGLDHGGSGQRDNASLLDRAQYLRWWNQYAGEDGSLELVDKPASISGRAVSTR